MKKAREGYKITEIGEIPQEWEVKRLGEVCDFYSGISVSRKNQANKGYYYLHYGDIHKKGKHEFDLLLDKEWMPKIEIDLAKVKNEVLLKTGDIVFVDASEDYEGIGKSVVINNPNNEVYIAGLHTIVGKEKSKIMDNGYKKYCFCNQNIRKQFRVIATGATVYGITKGNLSTISIPIPSLPEQQKIADILSAADEQIENVDKLIEKTKELKKGLMQRLLTKGIGHKEFKKTEIGEIPKDWEVKKLREVIYESNERNKENKNIQVLSINNKQGFVLQYEQFERKVHSKNTSNYKIVYKNQFAYNPSRINVGSIALLKEFDKGIISPMYVVFSINNNIIKETYLEYWFKMNRFLQFVNVNTQGSVRDSLNFDELSEFLIPVPDIEEQQQIADILSTVDTQLEEYQSKKEKLETLKKGLMQKLLTGKIRVKV
ncbi:MAG: restriction endonuclease subunit S [Caloramator sp.]|nr:restriction endonuclease subunit S [Caloramator sp.]